MYFDRLYVWRATGATKATKLLCSKQEGLEKGESVQVHVAHLQFVQLELWRCLYLRSPNLREYINDRPYGALQYLSRSNF